MTEKEKRRRYYLKNREKIKAQVRAYRAANIEKYREYDRSPERRQKSAAFSKRYYHEHKEEQAAYQKAYRLTHHEAVYARQHRWYEQNKSRVIAKATECNRSNPKRKENCQAYYRSHKDEARAGVVLRRARQAAATIGDIEAIRALYKRIRNARRVACHWCGHNIPKGHRTVDHVIPLAKGGTHCVTNLVPSCAPCNRKKHTKLPHEWHALQPSLF